MNILKKGTRQKKHIFVGGKDVAFDMGDGKIEYIDFWYKNPRLEGLAEFLVDDDEGTKTEKCMEMLYKDDNVRELRKTISKDGGVNNPIYIYKFEDDVSYSVLDGNCRFASIKKLNEADSSDKRWHTVPCIVLKNLPLTEILRIALRENVVGAIPWTPYAEAKCLFDAKSIQISDGVSEDEAIDTVFKMVESKNYTSKKKVKDLIATLEYIDKYDLDKDKFSIVREGYIQPGNVKKIKAVIEDEGLNINLDQVFLNALNQEEGMQKKDGRNFNAIQFRKKINNLWKGGSKDNLANTQKKDALLDFLKGKMTLDDAGDTIASRFDGELEVRKIREFYEFVDGSTQQRQSIIKALFVDDSSERKLRKTKSAIEVLLNGLEGLRRYR